MRTWGAEGRSRVQLKVSASAWRALLEAWGVGLGGCVVEI